MTGQIYKYLIQDLNGAKKVLKSVRERDLQRIFEMDEWTTLERKKC